MILLKVSSKLFQGLGIRKIKKKIHTYVPWDSPICLAFLSKGAIHVIDQVSKPHQVDFVFLKHRVSLNGFDLLIIPWNELYFNEIVF